MGEVTIPAGTEAYWVERLVHERILNLDSDGV
jgi:hypothetical protein